MKNPLPKIKRRADRNLAYVTIKGRRIYLGKWGSAETYRKYAQIISDPTFASSSEKCVNDELAPPLKMIQDKRGKNRDEKAATISTLFSAYTHSYQTRPRYSRTDLNRIKHTLSVILETVSDIRIKDFGIIEMKKIKDRLLSSTFKHGGKEQHYSRSYINKILGTIKTAFRFGANELICSENDWMRIKCLDLVRAGRTQARESEGYRLITDEEFSAVLPYLQPFYRDMITLLESCGMRPSELCSMRGDEIDRSKDIWVYTPSHHKTATRGKQRYIAFTKEERKLLEKYMNDGYLFTPERAVREQGRTRANPSSLRDFIDPLSLSKRLKDAVRKAIKAGKLKEPWTLYNLRHKAITRIRVKYGVEYAQHFAGHSTILTQQYYDHSAESMVTKLAETR